MERDLLIKFGFAVVSWLGGVEERSLSIIRCQFVLKRAEDMQNERVEFIQGVNYSSFKVFAKSYR